MRVLLIESDRFLADNLASILKSAAHDVVWRTDLQAALEVIDDKKPDAIILDLLLASRSGVEFLYEIRSYPEWHDLPVIIWSDLSQSELETLRASLKNLGIVSYHHKSTTKLKDLLEDLNLTTAPV